MNKSASFDMNDALQSPASVFSKPLDVVNHPGLTVEMKFKVLDKWERDARVLAMTDEANAAGGEETMLVRVRQAMRELDIRADPRAHSLAAGPKH